MPNAESLVRGGVVVTLGSKQHHIKQLKWGDEKKWRQMVSGHLNTLPLYFDMLSALTPAQLLSNQTVTRESKETAPLEVNLTKMLQRATMTVSQYPETAYELLLLYAPELATDEARADMDEHGTADQVIAAFLEVLKLAYPFWGDLLNLLKLGRKSPATSMS